MQDILEDNKQFELQLNDLYFKFCTKRCPNTKCGVRIAKDKSGCTHVQCTKCWTFMCWSCGNVAKGQKHFKEHPECMAEDPSLLPVDVTDELI